MLCNVGKLTDFAKSLVRKLNFISSDSTRINSCFYKTLFFNAIIKVQGLRCNMAQRAVNHEEDEEMTKKSGISGLPAYWQDHKRQPPMDWDRWRDLFFMSLMGKYSIQVQEILREVGQGEHARPRNTALMGGNEFDIAEKKVISLLYLSIGGAGRKTLTDKYPNIVIISVTLEELLNNCQATFQKKRNRCLDW